MLIQADARELPLRDGCVQCVVTSPPYFGLRDYGTGQWVGGDEGCAHAVAATGATQNRGNNNHLGTPFRRSCRVCGAERVDHQIGLESDPEAYVTELVTVFRELRRVLRNDGVCWLNLGDSYNAQQGQQHLDTLEERLGCGGGHKASAQRFSLVRQADGIKPKDLLGMPWRVAFALQADGWYLRSDIIWAKPNPMPESVTDRPTKAHEYVFLLTKQSRYYYDAQAIAEPMSLAMLEQLEHGYDGLGLKDYEGADVQNPSSVKARILANVRMKSAHMEGTPRKDGDRWRLTDGGVAPRGMTRNCRSVWTIATTPYLGAHFAVMPEALVEPCILAGSRFGDLVLDPFSGSGTVLAVAERLGRRGMGIDLNRAYHELARERTAQRGLPFCAAAS